MSNDVALVIEGTGGRQALAEIVAQNTGAQPDCQARAAFFSPSDAFISMMRPEDGVYVLIVDGVEGTTMLACSTNPESPSPTPAAPPTWTDRLPGQGGGDRARGPGEPITTQARDLSVRGRHHHGSHPNRSLG